MGIWGNVDTIGDGDGHIEILLNESAIEERVNKNDIGDIVENLASNVSGNLDDNDKIEDITNMGNQVMSMGFEVVEEISQGVEISSISVANITTDINGISELVEICDVSIRK